MHLSIFELYLSLPRFDLKKPKLKGAEIPANPFTAIYS